MKRRSNYILIGMLIIFYSGIGKAYSVDWSFLGVSDTHNGDGLQFALQQASSSLLAPVPAFLVHAGDLDPISRTEDIVTTYFGKPFFPSMGNHDKDPDRQYFYESFYLNRKLPYLIDSMFIKEEGAEALIYSYAYENAYFIILDQYYRVPFRNYGNVTGKQLEWLEHQLVNNTYSYVFVVGHEPAYPQGWQRNYGDCLDRNPEDRDRFWAVLSKYQVTAYLTGHTHSYLTQYIQHVWHIDMGQCFDIDNNNKIIHFIINENSIQVNVHYPDGRLHDHFSIMPRNNVIPVELSLFSYEIVNKCVDLIWHTATESNNYGFEIQRGNDNHNFNRIGFIAGRGTTQNPQIYEFTDQVSNAATYYYRLKQLDNNGEFHFSQTIEVAMGQPTGFQLIQNYPNPFNQETIISYQIDKNAFVTLEIYNTNGQLVNKIVDNYQNAGIHQTIWKGTDAQGTSLPSGFYLCRLSADMKQRMVKMLLTR